MSDDVVDLILADHRRFEDLFRQLRSAEADRRQALTNLSELLVAHAEAEESDVYPFLRRLRDVPESEVDHGAEEHAEGHRALLELLEVSEPGSSEWDEKLENLSESITHHLDEEERTILNDARQDVDDDRRTELGVAFAAARRKRLQENCGRVEYVRDLVRQRGV